jgi:hypothetical protein
MAEQPTFERHSEIPLDKMTVEQRAYEYVDARPRPLVPCPSYGR